MISFPFDRLASGSLPKDACEMDFSFGLRRTFCRNMKKFIQTLDLI